MILKMTMKPIILLGLTISSFVYSQRISGSLQFTIRQYLFH